MIDLHAHILPGVDDGAQTIADSRALAQRAAAEGITAIAATPHVRAEYPTSADTMERLVAELRSDFRAHGIPVDVLHGGEIDLEMLPRLDRAELARFTLAQSRRYLLIEFPYVGWAGGLEQRLFDLGVAGFVPVLAHPERNREVQRDPARLEPIVRGGTLVQVTAASLDGRLGRSSQLAAERLLGLGLVHLLASDAHTPDIREVGLRAAAKAVRDDGLARYLTEDAPAAVAAGEDLPERPPRMRRRRLLPF